MDDLSLLGETIDYVISLQAHVNLMRLLTYVFGVSKPQQFYAFFLPFDGWACCCFELFIFTRLHLDLRSCEPRLVIAAYALPYSGGLGQNSCREKKEREKEWK
ncbi:hypothetical protein KSP40_PGU008214 [Platanthera guangdongensis]|uniref:Uncharacterized protein n=1 Tax=Platanthera guangdongensis TaxID=2320717 RepID=A0ABR2N5P9_9ASPA